jgi:hypothetical protein
MERKEKPKPDTRGHDGLSIPRSRKSMNQKKRVGNKH